MLNNLPRTYGSPTLKTILEERLTSGDLSKALVISRHADGNEGVCRMACTAVSFVLVPPSQT